MAIRKQEANYRKWRGNQTGVAVTVGAAGAGRGSDSETVTAGVKPGKDLEKSDAACATSRDRNKPGVPILLLIRRARGGQWLKLRLEVAADPQSVHTH